MSVKFETIVDFFGSFEIPNEPLKIGEHAVITDPKKFVQSHIKTLQSNRGKRTFLPYYERLLKVYKIYNDDRSKRTTRRNATTGT